MRNPNRCWITQGDHRLVHREKRVLAKREEYAIRTGDLGETHCGKPLDADRRRMNDLPGEPPATMCQSCWHGYIEEHRFR